MRVHDPLADAWGVDEVTVENILPDAVGQDGIVFAVGHSAYEEVGISSWLAGSRPWLIDANHVLTADQRADLVSIDYPHLFSIGRGFK